MAALRQWMIKNILCEDEDDLRVDISLDTLTSHSRQLGIHTTWLYFLRFNMKEIKKLKEVNELVESERKNRVIYPISEHVHRWSTLCYPQDVRVVIIGQDPYHDGSACGVAFGTMKGHPPPPSLQIIFNELQRTVPNFRTPRDGCLDNWADEGVLLLNSVFTVVMNHPGSHGDLGWQLLSDRILKSLSEEREGLVFMLWGFQAQQKEYLLDSSRHCILRSGHPSPKAQSARKPFLGNNHFQLANEYFASRGECPINWSVIC